jgi:hypothetical protein
MKLDRDAPHYSFRLASPTLFNTMDDEDQFGIPSDYYSHYSGTTPRHYSENFPTSSFDEFLDESLADKPFEDFGEYMRVVLIGSTLY